jgi:hypothetical protein
MSSPIPSFTTTKESYSDSPNPGDGSQGGSLEKPEGQSLTPERAKCEHEAIKGSGNVGPSQKKADADWNEDIKRLRDDTKDLGNQFAALAVQLVEMALLIRQLQENAGTPT